MAADSKKVIVAALIGNSLVAVSKYVAAIITGSSAMLTEGIHSTIDSADQVLMLVGNRKAKKPANALYPFGRGKEIYFWSFVVAILIFALGSGISIYEGVHRFMDPSPIESFTVNYVILGLAILFEGYTWFVARKEFKKSKGNRGYIRAVREAKDPQTFVVLFEDSAALVGLFAALAGNMLVQFTGDIVYDGIASVTIGAILGVTAIWLAFETKGLLIGERADPEIVKGISEMAKSYKGVNSINDTLTMHMGPEYILVNLSVDFEDDLSAGTVENTISKLTRNIREKFPRVKRVFVEAESPEEAEKSEF